MRRLATELLVLSRLELAEVVRSRWVAVCLGLYGVLAAAFVLVGLRESAVMGFTGMGRVLFSLCHALVFLLPLVALGATGQVVNRARAEGALELLMSHPVRRGRYFASALGVRCAALVIPLVALLALLAALGGLVFGQPVPAGFVARSAAVCAALLFAFAALGLAISTWIRSAARAMTYLVLAWMLAVALLDFGLIGLLLEWHFPPRAVFALAALNPVQAARLALLSAAEPDLAVLGPVGFYLAHRLGPDALLALGIGWPLAFGLAAAGLALRSFRRSDLV